ncbi:MAG: hypothetical protein KDC24_15045, partial [Saprospiraceae bacterium]|nr:hypothetical protein [Saprospiraceae bacterium]
MRKGNTKQQRGLPIKGIKLTLVIVLWLIGWSYSTVSAQEPIWREHRINEEFAKAKLNLIHEHSNGMLWFGTSEGLFYYDGLQYYPVPFSNPAPVDPSIHSITNDLAGKVWVGLEDGALYFQENFGLLQYWHPEINLPTSPITGIVFGKDSSMWFSTYGEGLYLYKNKELHHFDLEDGLSGLDIYQIKL